VSVAFANSIQVVIKRVAPEEKLAYVAANVLANRKLAARMNVDKVFYI
jgi:hypothetical protein